MFIIFRAAISQEYTIRCKIPTNKMDKISPESKASNIAAPFKIHWFFSSGLIRTATIKIDNNVYRD